MLQVPLGEMLIGEPTGPRQVSVSVKSAGFAPLNAILEKTSAPVPPFVARIPCGWLAVPASWLPKLMLVRLNDTAACVAVPDNGTVSWFPDPP